MEDVYQHFFMQLAMPLAELTWQGRLIAADLCALTPVLGMPVHPCGTFTLDRCTRLPLAHAASLFKFRGHHVDLRYLGGLQVSRSGRACDPAHAWMAGLARCDCRPCH